MKQIEKNSSKRLRVSLRNKMFLCFLFCHYTRYEYILKHQNMVTLAIHDEQILSKYNNDEIVWRISHFFEQEFWVKDGIILYSMDIETSSKDIQMAYQKSKKLPNSAWVNY